MMGSTTQRQVRINQFVRKIDTMIDEGKTTNEIKTTIEKDLMALGFAWHTRRDYLLTLGLW